MKINVITSSFSNQGQIQAIRLKDAALYSVVQFSPQNLIAGLYYSQSELEYASKYYLKALVLEQNKNSTKVLKLSPELMEFSNNDVVFPLLVDSVNLKGKFNSIPAGGAKVGNKIIPNVSKMIIPKKKGSNGSHLKLKRDKEGHFIKMDDIAEFDYPHADDGCNQFRIVKVISETPDFIEGIQTNCGNTGFKKFKKNRIQGLYQYKGYLK